MPNQSVTTTLSEGVTGSATGEVQNSQITDFLRESRDRRRKPTSTHQAVECGPLPNHDMVTPSVPPGSAIKIEEVQVLIICALDIEMNALLAILDNGYGRLRTQKEIHLFTGKFNKVNVAVMQLTEKGQVFASKNTEEVVSELNSNAYVISAGICGGTGLDSKDQRTVYLGDVVISRDICRFNTHIVDDRIVLQASSSETVRAHDRLKKQLNVLGVADSLPNLCGKALNHLQALENRVESKVFESWSSTPATKPPDDLDRLYKPECARAGSGTSRSHGKEKDVGCDTECLERPSPAKDRRFNIHIGHYGSEDAVVKSGTPYTRELLRKNKIIAVDMEGRGISQAAITHVVPAVVIIKGVSDYANSQKNDDWQGYAAATAACTIKAFVVEFFSSLREARFTPSESHRQLPPPHPELAQSHSSADAQICLTSVDYSIALLCSPESPAIMAAMCMMDDRYQEPRNWCRIPCKFGAIRANDGGSCHNIVIASVQSQGGGSSAMQEAITALRAYFPKLRLFISLANGGGIPRPAASTDAGRDIHLGDVVVAVPRNPHTALLRHHPPMPAHSQHTSNHPPPFQLLPKVPADIQEITKAILHATQTKTLNLSCTMRRLDLGKGFQRPHQQSDRLHKVAFTCEQGPSDLGPCSCAEEHLEDRPSREFGQDGFIPAFHRGQVICSTTSSVLGRLNELVSTYPEALCLETEAASLPQDIPALVVRGISHYAGSPPKSQWAAYAVGAAAAFARELIRRLPARVTTSATTHSIRKTYMFDSISDDKSLYDVRQFGDDSQLCLDMAKDVWERMTVSGIAIYEQIYAQCADANGEVELHELKPYFPGGDAQTKLDESWEEMTKVSKSPPPTCLGHSLTLAVIYMVHLRVWAKEGKSSFAISQHDKKRRARLRNFANWVQCNCGDEYCPCLWNFVNRAGLCRNPSPTCKAHQWMDPDADRKDGYDRTQYEFLRRKWGGSGEFYMRRH